jgi:hypothetical protein
MHGVCHRGPNLLPHALVRAHVGGVRARKEFSHEWDVDAESFEASEKRVRAGEQRHRVDREVAQDGGCRSRAPPSQN